MARPSKYRVFKCVKAALLSSAEGATDLAIADGCGVSVETVRDWINPQSPRFKPGFSRAVKEARARCGSVRENSLYRKSTWQIVVDESEDEVEEWVLPPAGRDGRKRVEDYIDKDPESDTHGLILKHTKRRSVSKRTLPPDTAALIFSLCNTDKDKWKHVSRIELTGEDGGPVKHEHLEGVPTEDLIAEAEAILRAAPRTEGASG